MGGGGGTTPAASAIGQSSSSSVKFKKLKIKQQKLKNKPLRHVGGAPGGIITGSGSAGGVGGIGGSGGGGMGPFGALKASLLSHGEGGDAAHASSSAMSSSSSTHPTHLLAGKKTSLMSSLQLTDASRAIAASFPTMGCDGGGQQPLVTSSSTTTREGAGATTTSICLGAEFGAKDHFLSSFLYAVRLSILSLQSPLPPFLIPDHFKASVKFSMKGSTSSASVFSPSIPFPLRVEAIARHLIESNLSSSSTIIPDDVTFEDILEGLRTTARAIGDEVPSVVGSAVMTGARTGAGAPDQLQLQVPLSLPTWIKVKEYAPIVFASLRDKVYNFATRSHFARALFDTELGPPIKCPFSPRAAYVSSDRQVVVKIVEGTDVESLLSLVKSLHPYFVQRKTTIHSHYQPHHVLSSSTTSQQQSMGQHATSSSTTTTITVVNSLLPQYLAVYRISHAGSAAHSLAGILASVPSSVSSIMSSAIVSSVAKGSSSLGIGGSGIGATSSLVSQVGKSMAGMGISGTSSSAENDVYVVLIRNAISCNESFFPIHSYFLLNDSGIKKIPGRTMYTFCDTTQLQQREAGGKSSSVSEDDNLTIILKKADADRLLANLESDLKFLSGHLLIGYTLTVGVHSIDEWERQLREEEEDEEGGISEEDEDGEEEAGPGGGLSSLAKHLAGPRGTSSGERHFEEEEEDVAITSTSQLLGKRGGLLTRKDSVSLVIDPQRYPFVLPSPFVGVDSRASSRPSLHGSESGVSCSGSVSTTTAQHEQSQQQLGQLTGQQGRFVYFIGFEDLLPLSASFSSKELDLEKKLEKKEAKEKEKKEKKAEKEREKAEKQLEKMREKGGHVVTTTDEEGEGGHALQGQGQEGEGTVLSREIMGKKEAAREYSRNLLNQLKKRLVIVVD